MDKNVSIVLSFWGIVLPAITGFITAMVSLVIAIRSQSMTKKLHDEDQRKRENEKIIKDAEHKLEEFYYPYLLIAKENTSLYEVFRKEYYAEDKSFRTLPALLEKKEFSENDMAILGQIIENDVALKKLINEKAHVIEDRNLREELIKSATHYAIIELAFNKKITGEVDRFRPYVHPNDVYEKVEKKTRELEMVIHNARQ